MGPLTVELVSREMQVIDQAVDSCVSDVTTVNEREEPLDVSIVCWSIMGLVYHIPKSHGMM